MSHLQTNMIPQMELLLKAQEVL